MKIDIPVMNPDGSLKYTQTLDAEQTQVLLQFALNFLVSTGMAAMYGVKEPDTDEQQTSLQFDD